MIVALREQPGLLGALVSKLTGVQLPRRLRPADATLRFVKPAELRLDLVLHGGRRRWVLVELQRSVDRPSAADGPSRPACSSVRLARSAT
ncbi:hypothetical protein [Sorangium atrum]|uniref:Uncharacterized protein n=1 Tax=Sorangium atrum TaxID=2995308 RepID=A0ABT5C8W9_9BACT|nr:hypothetical protein [Sorangium aterium]MDC0682835.1 hypothetical protein [Sorangium aterium]